MKKNEPMSLRELDDIARAAIAESEQTKIGNAYQKDVAQFQADDQKTSPRRNKAPTLEDYVKAGMGDIIDSFPKKPPSTIEWDPPSGRTDAREFWNGRNRNYFAEMFSPIKAGAFIERLRGLSIDQFAAFTVGRFILVMISTGDEPVRIWPVEVESLEDRDFFLRYIGRIQTRAATQIDVEYLAKTISQEFLTPIVLKPSTPEPCPENTTRQFSFDDDE